MKTEPIDHSGQFSGVSLKKLPIGQRVYPKHENKQETESAFCQIVENVIPT